MGLVDQALAGSVRAIARLATHIENDDDLGVAALELLYPHSGRAQTIGVTGPPGAGKSSLVNALVGRLRAGGQTAAVLAVDPSSPLTGGAALGDRIRMLEHHGDPGVFVRSAASRGRSGGLAPATAGLIHLFDAAGFDVVIVETVGIGQEEIDVVNYVESVLLVQAPGFGDGIQAMKAGVLEVADIYVVNKADLPGAQTTVRELRAMLTFAASTGHGDGWERPVIAVSARDATGVEELALALESRREWMREGSRLEERRSNIAAREIGLQVRRMLEARRAASGDDLLQRLALEVARRERSPRSAASRLVEAASRPA